MKIPEGFKPVFVGSSTLIKIRIRRKRLLRFYFDKMKFRKFIPDTEKINKENAN